MLAVIAALLVNRYGFQTTLAHLKFNDVTDKTIAFAGLSFGASITGTALVLTLPEDRLLRTMVINGPGVPKINVSTRQDGSMALVAEDGQEAQKPTYPDHFRSMYSDLVFVFTWTAVVQVWLATSGMVAFFLAGETNLAECRDSVAHLAAVALFVQGVVYAVLQLASGLSAYTEFARNRETFIRNTAFRTGPPPA